MRSIIMKKYSRGTLCLLLAVSAASLLLLTGCSDVNNSFLDPKGPIAAAQKTHFISVTLYSMIAAGPVFILVPFILWRYRYKNNNMQDLEEQLKAAQSARFRMIATDGVFSMDGYIANLPAICDRADKYDALVMVDDSHSVGFMGRRGRGTHEHHGVMDRIDIITGTLGKALGGASGGYTSGRREIVELLRQRSRPYLFSNSVAPPIVAASIR